MEKVVPLFEPFTNIFYFKIFQLQRVLLRSVKIWIWLKSVWNLILNKIFTAAQHCSSGPRAPPFPPLFRPRRPTGPPFRAHVGPLPSSARPGWLPHLPLPFSLPLCSAKTPACLLMELPSPVVLSPRPALPKLLLTAVSHCQHRSRAQPSSPRPAISSGETSFPLHLPLSAGAPCVPMAKLAWRFGDDARQRKANCSFAT
jgi:hypothetical protein